MAERFRLTLALCELGESMMRQQLRRSRPNVTEEEIEAGIEAWRQRRPGAEHGDSVGRQRPWPAEPS